MTMQKYHLELVKENSFTYKKSHINSPQTIATILRDTLKMHLQSEEIFVCLCLDTKNNIIGIFEVSRGTINSSLVHPREVFKRALLCNAASIIVAHNHPSGEVNPSREDIAITDRLQQAGNLLGIEMLDHIIIGDESTYYSFRDDHL